MASDDYKMNEAEVVNYIRQVCEGLENMHENNIVHLDIKVHTCRYIILKVASLL